MPLLGYEPGHTSELEAMLRAAAPVVGAVLAFACVAVPVAMRRRRREAIVALASALLAVAMGLLMVLWLL